MNYSSTKKMVLAAMFLALSVLLSYLVHLLNLGQVLLPMHLPVLLCGFICGGFWGLAIGFIAPFLNFLILSMPPIFPMGVIMAFELATYGVLAGLFYRLLPKKVEYIYVSLILTMICGRIVWSLVSWAAASLGFASTPFTWEVLLSGAFITAFPGIIIQIVLIPAIMIALQLTQSKRKKQLEAV